MRFLVAPRPACRLRPQSNFYTPSVSSVDWLEDPIVRTTWCPTDRRRPEVRRGGWSSIPLDGGAHGVIFATIRCCGDEFGVGFLSGGPPAAGPRTRQRVLVTWPGPPQEHRLHRLCEGAPFRATRFGIVFRACLRRTQGSQQGRPGLQQVRHARNLPRAGHEMEKRLALEDRSVS